MRKLLPIVGLLLAFASCQQADDFEKPTIEIDSPKTDDVVLTDDGLRVVATLSDNTGLLQYKIEVVGIDSLNDVGADSTYSIIYIDAVPGEGKALYLDHTIELPSNTFNGKYQMIMTCVDVEGNQALRDTVLFEIRNNADYEPPVFNLISAVSAGDTIGYGFGFGVDGTVSDSQSLIYSDIYVGNVSGSKVLLEQEFPYILDNTVDFSTIEWWFQVDSTWTPGQYHIYVTAWDNYSGVSQDIPFYVKY